MDDPIVKPSRFRDWWSFDSGADRWASLAVLGLGIAGSALTVLFF